MRAQRHFPDEIVEILHTAKSLGIQAGSQGHRFIRIWVVVVEGRVFVRSWSLKPHGWYRAFLKEPTGIIKVDSREFPVRAVQTRSNRLKDAIDRAYLDKYSVPVSMKKYALDLGRAESRASTTELVPQ